MRNPLIQEGNVGFNSLGACLFVFTIEKTKETEGKRKVIDIEYNLGSD
jgi:hypothetical protein